MVNDLPVIEEFCELKTKYNAWLNEVVEDDEVDILVLFKQFYGEDLGSVCLDFFYEFGGAELYDIIWSSKQ